ncbi:MAG TPA: hypothetical protein VFQ39_13345 [Longimicrobium sp.]|nr:hypothetical protein [Longimicrobium sp.]
MRKMTLHPDTLRVESFATLPPPPTGGTVLGRQEWIDAPPVDSYKADCRTFGGDADSCGFSCVDTCRCDNTRQHSCNPQTECTCLGTCMTCTLDVCCPCTGKASGCAAQG